MATDETNPSPPTNLPDFLEKLEIPEEEKAQLAQAWFIQTTSFVQAISRPVPSPGDMARYHAIDPALANRLISMAENQQEMEHKLQLKIIESDRRKINGAIFLGALLIAAAMFALHQEKHIVAVVLGLAGTASSILSRIIVWLDHRRDSSG